MSLNKKEIKVFLESTISGGAIVLFSSLIRYGLEKAYRIKRGYYPPKDPYSRKSGALKSLVWGASVGAIIGITTTFVRPLLQKEIGKFLNN